MTFRLALAIALLCSTALQGAEIIRDIATRTGVTQRFLLIRPDKPVASVILFAGGHGGLNIHADGSFGWGRGNFLVRTRELFAREGLMVAVIDAPSDRLPSPGLNNFRQTPEHATDVAHVIEAVRKEANVPVWLVGTSRGTTSAAYAAIALKEGGPDGIVLSSSIVGGRDSGNLIQTNLAEIRVPVLVVHHEQDECRVTLFEDAKRLVPALVNSPRKELIAFRGGGPVKGPPCEARHWHGFAGIEREVVARIAGWIKAGSERRVKPGAAE